MTAAPRIGEDSHTLPRISHAPTAQYAAGQQLDPPPSISPRRAPKSATPPIDPRPPRAFPLPDARRVPDVFVECMAHPPFFCDYLPYRFRALECLGECPRGTFVLLHGQKLYAAMC